MTTSRKSFYVLLAIVAFAWTGCSGPSSLFMVKEAQKSAPAKVVVDNQSKKAERYEWDFGDGETSTELAPTHTYYASGNYIIKLKAIKGGKMNESTQPIVVQAPKECLVEIQTRYGNMLAVLYNSTPKHRDNFTKLADQGFYDNLSFHRVIKGFMIQGGDPNSRKADAYTQLGSGGPGYTTPAEFVDSLVHVKGALAAARTGDQVNPKRESSGSQFYIVQGQPVSAQMLDQMEGSKGIHYTPEQRKVYMEQGGTPFLDKDYTVFGKVIEGLDVLGLRSHSVSNP